MDFIVKIPDQVIQEEPELKNFIRALQLMLDRMSTSHFKYGNMKDKYPEFAHAVDNVSTRFNLYNKTGNIEHCLDMANFCVIEFLYSGHPKKHYKTTDGLSTGIEYK